MTDTCLKYPGNPTVTPMMCAKRYRRTRRDPDIYALCGECERGEKMFKELLGGRAEPAQEVKECCVDGCIRPVRAKNMCINHYQKLWYKKKTTVEKVLAGPVEPDEVMDTLEVEPSLTVGDELPVMGGGGYEAQLMYVLDLLRSELDGLLAGRAVAPDTICDAQMRLDAIVGRRRNEIHD